MQNTIPTLGSISWGRRLMPATAALGILLVSGFAQTASAQAVNGLTISDNYFVTGDYVVGGWDFTTGRISIPDLKQPDQTSLGVPNQVPVGADIVAAFLYWETVESTLVGAPTGRNGSFNGYPIAGTQLGNPEAPASWSAGGCAGSNLGSKTIHAYRADVRPLLPVDPTTGRIQGNGSFPVSLAGPGSNQTPFTVGASLVIIYRVQSPLVPLNSIVLYDGAVAPSNQTNAEMIQTIQGFYQPDGVHKAKLTHIVGDGQPNKSESVTFQNQPLPFLYPGISTTAAFPGIYNGSWDNATWDVTDRVSGIDTFEQTSVAAAQSGGGCVDWGAIIFSTTVKNSANDGLLDVWKANHGYTDVNTGQLVALPGATNGEKDIFVEVDYLRNLSIDPGSAGTYLHSHLPKQEALDRVGDALCFRDPVTLLCRGAHVHFDVGNVYQIPRPGGPSTNCGTVAKPVACDPYIITNPAGTGGNPISESVTLCTDGATLCAFPGTPTVGWKEGFVFIKRDASVPHSNPPIPLGNFQVGRKDSYHYVLFGHALGTPRSFWTAFGATLQSTSFAKLISIVNSGTTAMVTIQTPPGLVKPGDCNPANLPPACSDANGDRVTVGGAIGQPALNGTYHFTNPIPSIVGNVTTTIFNIATTNTTTTCPTAPCVANGTYNFSNESQLMVSYGGPVSTSGHSDVGGGDTAVTFGLWPADDDPGCQADPSVGLAPGQTYCTNQVGTITAEAGTLLHEIGHTLFLTHGGTFFPNGALQGRQTNFPPAVPSYGLNCNPGFLSSMNYLFQIRGFPDFLADGITHTIDYSRQTLPSLSESGLNETSGIGRDMFTGATAAHFTRWYAPPNPLDTQVGRFATVHCDGTAIGPGEPPAVRVTGSTFSAPIDWNNDLDPVPDPNPQNPVPWQDVNFNGSTSSVPDPPLQGFNNMQGFNDWINADLRQVGSRGNTFGFSGSGSITNADTGSGSILNADAGSGTILTADTGSGSILNADAGSGSILTADAGSGIVTTADAGSGIVTTADAGNGSEQDVETACSTADPPRGLMAALGFKSVVLNWTAPEGPCQVRTYNIWRSTNGGPFAQIGNKGRVKGAPSTTFTDFNVKNNNTYTYFVTDTDTQGATSPASNQKTIFVSP